METLMAQNNSEKFDKNFIFVFLFVLVYWIYLILNTDPVIVYDAIGYKNAGRLLMEKGWVHYFSVGLNREPLFSFLISCSMFLEKWTNAPFHIFLKIFLLFFLSLTMAGVYQLVRLMGTSHKIAILAVFYLGISPALINSTLWLWSEAATYPWVIGIVLSSIKIWQGIHECRKTTEVLFSSVCLAVMFFMLTMVKAIAALVFVIYLWPYVGAGIYYIFKRDLRRLGRVLLALLMVAGFYFVMIEEYKNLNFRYNGHYQITFQDSGVLFGNTIRRLLPLNMDRINQALLFTPRLGFCQEFYHGECIFWGCQFSDGITSKVFQEMDALGLNDQEKQAFFMSESLRWIKAHPIQEFFMSCLEASKMFFWETKLFFVNYPAWLHQLHCTPLIVLGLSFTWALLSILGFIFGIRQTWKLRQSSAGVAFLFTTSFIFCFMGVYSLFFIDLRYALPIVPLFVALAFVWLERLIYRSFS